MYIAIRQAKVEDAPFIAQAEREIAKEPGFFCSQPFEFPLGKQVTQAA